MNFYILHFDIGFDDHDPYKRSHGCESELPHLFCFEVLSRFSCNLDTVETFMFVETKVLHGYSS